MRIVSTHIFCNQRLHTALLDRLQQAGADGVELFCARQSFDYTEPVQIESLASWFRQNALQLHSLHSPIHSDTVWGRSGEPPLDISHPDRRRRLAAVDEVQKVLELADSIPYRYLIQHLGAGGVESDDRRIEAGFSSLERLHVLAKQAGVTILLENIPNGLSTPENLLEFLNQTHLSDIGVCFDIGHAHLPGAQFGGDGAVRAFDLLRGRMRSTHLHDNCGQRDDHFWPGDGSIAWAEFMPKLAAQPELPWLLEIGNQPAEPATFTRLQESWQRLEAWAGGANHA